MKMGILDNAINKALKVETITVSPEQMVNLVETKLVPICSEKELKELKKGMEKTWVLASGGSSSLRYYPSQSKEVKICLDFNMLTKQLAKLSLMDTTAKQEFVLPKGGNYAKQAQQMIMNKLLTMNSANINAFAQPVQPQQAMPIQQQAAPVQSQQAAPMQQQAIPVQPQQAATVQSQQAVPTQNQQGTTVQPPQMTPVQPQQTTPVQPPYNYAPNNSAEKKNNGQATASLILGIVSLFACIIPLLGYPCSIVGLVLGIVGKKKKAGGTAIAGIVLSSIGLACTLINSVVGAMLALV